MVKNNRRTRLRNLYSIKYIGGTEYGNGFYDCLDFFDKKVGKFLKDKKMYIEFVNFLADEQENAYKKE